MVKKSPNAFRTISEVADALEVPAHVLRFWESKFNQIKPVKRGGGRRYYRPTDLELIRGIRDLLYSDGLTIKGVQKVLREKGVRHVMAVGSANEDLWDEPEGTQLEQQEPVQEPVAAAPEPAVAKQVAPLDRVVAEHKARTQEPLFEMAESQAPPPRESSKVPLEVVKKPQPQNDTLSLFDDLEPAEKPCEKPAEASSNPDKKNEIRIMIGRLEELRDRMKSD